MTQQEQFVQHIAIEQIIKWKMQFPKWRGEQSRLMPGNDVPAFCDIPSRLSMKNSSHNDYRVILATKENQPGWGYWNFVKTPTSEFDIKPNPAPEISAILRRYEAFPAMFRLNNFIFNDPGKPPAEQITIDPILAAKYNSFTSAVNNFENRFLKALQII